VIKLLEEIKRKHGIEYKEIVVADRDWYPEKKANERSLRVRTSVKAIFKIDCI